MPLVSYCPKDTQMSEGEGEEEEGVKRMVGGSRMDWRQWVSLPIPIELVEILVADNQPPTPPPL